MMKPFHTRRARVGGWALVIALVSLAAACTASESSSSSERAASSDSATTGSTATVPSNSPDEEARTAPRTVVDSSAPAGRERLANPSSVSARPAPPSTQPATTGSSERSARKVVVQGMDLSGVGYDKGNPTAPVVVVNFSDFGCPFCGSFARQTEPVIEKEYVRTGKVFFKYVPFVMGMFPNGDEAAHASECAAEQGRFWPMHDALYANQTEWKKARDPLPAFERYAKAIGLELSRFAACYAVPDVAPGTMRANVAAGRLGVRVTPSFVVNGKGVEGALPLPQFRQQLDAALKEAR